MLNGLRVFAALLALAGFCAYPACVGWAAPGWITVKVGSVLTLDAPPGTTFKAAHGDSFVGTLAGPGFALQLDYGLYSDPLTDRTRFSAYASQVIRIDGRAGSLVSGTLKRSSRHGEFIGLHVPQLGHSPLGALGLTIAGVVPRAKEVDVVRRIFQTIRFVAKR